MARSEFSPRDAPELVADTNRMHGERQQVQARGWHGRRSGSLTGKQIRRGVDRGVDELEAAINAFLDRHNAAAKPFRSVESADRVLADIERLYTYNTSLT